MATGGLRAAAVGGVMIPNGGNEPGKQRNDGRAREALRRGVGGGRKAARRVRSWSQTRLGRVVILIGAMAGAVIFFFALVGAPSIFRGTPVSEVIELDGAPPPFGIGSPEFRGAAEQAMLTDLTAGSVIEVLNNGNEFFPRLWSDLRAGTRSITVVNYYASPGQLADSLAHILIDRAKRGVRVFFVYDPIGSIAVDAAWYDRLREGGVRVAEFRPLRWYRLDRANHRTHVRGIVIDGVVGYTGGYGFDDRWMGDGRSPDQWRDTNVRVVGPPVDMLQAIFVAHWAEAAGELLAGDVLGAPQQRVHATTETAFDGRASGPLSRRTATTDNSSDGLAAMMGSPASLGSSVAERTLALSIAAAHQRLLIANAYFVPDDDLVGMLCRSAGSGVDVRVLTNGALTDVPVVWRAGRHRYEELLGCGVRIYEYQPTVMHSKTLVADGLWSIVGTINFDNRSLAFNSEVSLVALDSVLGKRLDDDFARDLDYAVEIELDSFVRRSPWQKFLERGADLVSRWL